MGLFLLMKKTANMYEYSCKWEKVPMALYEPMRNITDDIEQAILADNTHESATSANERMCR
jgi:hypothetical protein